jgi:hypothetical protein
MAKSSYASYIFVLMLSIGLPSCKHDKKLYKSDCDIEKKFKRITLVNLMDSLAYYDNQCVEVSGKYKQDKGLSALFNDGIYISRKKNKPLWVEFSPDCPLYLAGTRIGFFDYDYNGGKLTPANDQTIVIHGVINAHYKGDSGNFKGSIGRISYIQL